MILHRLNGRMSNRCRRSQPRKNRQYCQQLNRLKHLKHLKHRQSQLFQRIRRQSYNQFRRLARRVRFRLYLNQMACLGRHQPRRSPHSQADYRSL